MGIASRPPITMSRSPVDANISVGGVSMMRLRGSGTLGKDIENQAVAVEDAHRGEAFEIAFLVRTECTTDQNQFCTAFLRALGDLFGLTGPGKITWIGTLDAIVEFTDDLGTGGRCQRTELLQFVLGRAATETHMHE